MSGSRFIPLVTLAALACLPPGGATSVRAADAVDQTISLDVVVTDRRGAVSGLGTADFELTEAGTPRQLDAVKPHAGGRRVIALFLDDFHVESGAGTERARAALLQLVRTQLRDGDRVAMLKPLDSLQSITFTSDRAAIEQAIEEFDGRKNDFAPRSTLEANLISRSPATAALSRAQIITAGLQALARRLGQEAEGRKALVLVSDGFQPVGGSRGIVYAANRNSVAIYTVDTRTAPTVEPESAEATTRMLATQTGGSAIASTGDLGAALVGITADLDNYYVITYRAPKTGDGRFHPIELRVKRPDVVARTRSGYWSADTSLLKSLASLPRPSALPVRPSRSSPFIQPWVGLSRTTEGATEVTITWEAGAAPPRNQRVIAVNLKAMTEDGTVLSQQTQPVPGRVAFAAPPGRVAVQMDLQGMNGSAIDTDYRIVVVPNLRVAKPTFGTPQFFRTRNAREFAQLSGDADASPTASRRFSRTERLLIRVPVYGAAGTPTVSATLLNVGGDPMRDLERVGTALPDGTIQFDLPLASLAPADYGLRLTAVNPDGPRDEAREVITFRVTN